MKHNYKFSLFLGTVYKQGNILFSPNGDIVIAPVGNKLSFYDLKSNKTETLPVESRYNYTTLAISPNGCILIAVNEKGDAQLISLISKTVVYRHGFKMKIRSVKFSPDGNYFAVTKENVVMVYKTPGLQTREYAPFALVRVIQGHFDETTSIDWSADSKVIAVGSKDMTTKVYPLKRYLNFHIYTLGGHKDAIAGCFFEKDSLDVYSVSRDGHVCVWESTVDLQDLQEAPQGWIPSSQKKRTNAESDSGNSSDSEDDLVENEEKNEVESKEGKTGVLYRRAARFFLNDLHKENGFQGGARLTSCSFHPNTHMLVTAYSNGTFFIHEMPDGSLIVNSSLYKERILDTACNSLAMNQTGDWLALGCRETGQLLVWEWQSEIPVLKQQGHFNGMTSLAYSPDGQYIATGGDDATVKIWNTGTGFCTREYRVHASSVTGVVFTQTGKVVLSASLDGTVRACDTMRYRNFRTLTSPRPAQFSCVAVDASGELVAAGGQDVFEIFLWSLQVGRLLEVLNGHEGPVSGVAFSPSAASSTLVSVSWDKTLRVWDTVETSMAREALTLTADGLDVCFRPDGKEVAVSTLDGQILFFDPSEARQVCSIDGRRDLGSGRSETDFTTAKKNLEGKAYTSLAYSADGSCILAGGQSKNICLYYVAEGILLKKFEVTQNRSLDAMDDFVSKRSMTDFGPAALLDERNEDDDEIANISLPGVKKGDLAARKFKPEVRIQALHFSPTGRSFGACSTEGLLVYSLDSTTLFDPFALTEDITPHTVRSTLKEKEYSSALMMSMRLNDPTLICEVFEQIPVNAISLVTENLPMNYVEKLLTFIASQVESSAHFEFSLRWLNECLRHHGEKIRPTWRPPTMKMMAILRDIQKALTKRMDDVSKICDFNRFTMQYLMTLSVMKQSQSQTSTADDQMSSGENSEGEMDFTVSLE